MRTKGAWRSIKEGLAALPPFDTSNAQKPEPKFVVSGTTLVRVPANGISAKESDYSKPKEAREHVWMQKNWAPNLVFHNDEHVLDINDSGDVDKCAEVLSFLHKEYKESGKHHAGIAVADKFASAGYLVPSDSPRDMWTKPQNWEGVKKILEGPDFMQLALSNLPTTMLEIYRLIYLPLKDGAYNWAFKAADEVNNKHGLAFAHGYEGGTKERTMHCTVNIASKFGRKSVQDSCISTCNSVFGCSIRTAAFEGGQEIILPPQLVLERSKVKSIFIRYTSARKVLQKNRPSDNVTDRHNEEVLSFHILSAARLTASSGKNPDDVVNKFLSEVSIQRKLAAGVCPDEETVGTVGDGDGDLKMPAHTDEPVVLR